MSGVTRGRVGANTLLVPDGALIGGRPIAGLQNAIDECLDAGDRHIAVDLSAVGVVGSEALNLFVNAYEGAVRTGGTFLLLHPNHTVERVLEMTELSERVLESRAASPALRKMPKRGQRIGEILLERGLVEKSQIEEALALQRETGRRMADQMVEKGWIRERDLLEALGDQLGLPYVDLAEGLYDPETAQLVEPEVSRRLTVLPLFCVRELLFLATTDPQSLPALETVEDLTGHKVRCVLSTSESILNAIANARAQGTDLSAYIGEFHSDLEVVDRVEISDHSTIDEMAEGSPVINLINGLIQRGIRDKASDIHIEPLHNRCRIRLRVDGVLYPVMSPPLDVHPALVSRLKVMAKLDIAERRLPQDGRIQVLSGGQNIDLRFSSLPGIFGEKIVLRVLDKNQSILEVAHLGLHESNLSIFTELLGQSHGLILVTGPTGSGKTTSLYAALNHLNSDERNTVTIEDPVEYQIDGLSQNQVRENVGLSFSRLLKHVLRQDPDVIMVGEIRERETAEIAIQAALTGHLVLSTLHTNDSTGAITRMLDMGIEPFLLASALRGVMAQRLIRRVCPECRTTSVAPEEMLRQYGIESQGQVRLARGRGCASCYDSGYKGRFAIHEILPCDADFQRLIVKHPTRDDLDQYVCDHGCRTLKQDGVARAVDGETTIEEVLRIVRQ